MCSSPPPLQDRHVISASHSLEVRKKHTFAMNPQKRPPRFPFCQCIALEEPGCSSVVSSFPNEGVIRRRVRGREPVLNVARLASQLVTYKILSVSPTKGEGRETNFLSCSFRVMLDEERLRTHLSTDKTCFVRDTYPNPVEYYP